MRSVIFSSKEVCPVLPRYTYDAAPSLRGREKSTWQVSNCWRRWAALACSVFSRGVLAAELLLQRLLALHVPAQALLCRQQPAQQALSGLLDSTHPFGFAQLKW